MADETLAQRSYETENFSGSYSAGYRAQGFRDWGIGKMVRSPVGDGTDTARIKINCTTCMPPEVECIAKGKAHKKCEFGCKVIVAIISKDNFMVGAQALHGNPYDGYTLNE